MPLFGPNIKKMKETRDIKGLSKLLNNSKMRNVAISALIELGNINPLIEALTSNNTELRVQVAEAIKDINNPEATEALNNKLINDLKYGEIDDQVEAITLIQGRYPKYFLNFVLSGEVNQEHTFETISTQLSLKTFRDALLGVIEKSNSCAIIWYALIALVELGDRSDEVLKGLIGYSHTYINALEDR